MILEDLRHSSRLNQAKLDAYLARQREENLQAQAKTAQQQAQLALDKAQSEIVRINLAYEALYRQVQDADATIRKLMQK
jgi:hypothetical protein